MKTSMLNLYATVFPIAGLFCLILVLSATRLPAQNLTVLHAFSASPTITNSDGEASSADLVLSGITLYGIALAGGTNGYGTVFSMNTNGSDFTVLHAFTNDAAGSVPQKRLVLSDDTLFGVAESGYSNGVVTGYGVVFSISTNGENFSVLYTFSTNTSGALGQPNAGLILSGGTFYGVAYQGGITNAGSIFSLDTNGTFHLLHLFNAGTDGENPLGALVSSGDTLYGTARNGGTNGLFGTVFSINTSGDNFTVLHTFAGSTNDAHNPQGALVLSGSTLYGTTVYGGTHGRGAVFAINTDGSGYTVLHSFNGADDEGVNPATGLTQRGNMLYGTTITADGSALAGSIYCLDTNGGNFAVLHIFSPPSGDAIGGTNTDGSQIGSSLAMSGNVLYGTATYGGVNGNGTVFSLAVIPQFTGLQLMETNLLLNGVNALAGTTATLLTSTNAAMPLNQWSPIATNSLADGGNFSFSATNAVNPAAAQQFYILQTQ